MRLFATLTLTLTLTLTFLTSSVAHTEGYDALTMCRTGQEAVRKFCIEEMNQITLPAEIGNQGYAEAQKGIVELKALRFHMGLSEPFCYEAYRNAIQRCKNAENQAAREMDDQARKDVHDAVQDIEKQFKDGKERFENTLKGVDQRIKDLESILDPARAAPPKSGDAGS